MIVKHARRTALGLLSSVDAGAGDTGGGAPPPPPPAAPAAPAPRPVPANGDRGFPDGTPIEQMTGIQRESYWKHYARTWEDKAKTFGSLSTDELTTLRDKAAKHDTLARDAMSEKDRAVAEATDKTRAEATPRVVRAEFRAAAKGLLTPAQLDALLEDRDLSKYADAKGDPDEAKIEKLVKAFAPVSPTTRTGPTATGLGTHRPPASAPGEQGRAMAEKRFGRPAAT